MSRRLPSLSPRQVIRALERAGFFIHHTTGSHCRLKHRQDARRATVVPRHARDLKRPVLHAIIRQAGLTPEEFLKLL